MLFAKNQIKCVEIFAASILCAIACIAIATPIRALESGSSSSDLAALDDGASQRINMSGKLRMLSQKISAVSCALAHSDHAEDIAPKLNNASQEFERIMQALRRGDDELGIFGAEKSRRILSALDKLDSLWAPFHTALQVLLKDGKDKEAEIFIAKNNMKLLSFAKLAVSEISAKYSNPVEVTGAEAMLVDFSGRQRMLTQKIAKESCGVVNGVAAFGTMDDMSKTISMFEVTHMALSNGMPNAGIAPPPNEDIRGGLGQADLQWQEIKQISDAIVGAGSIDSAALEKLFVLLGAELKQMNKVTGLYSAYAKATK